MTETDTPFLPAATLEWIDNEPSSREFSDRYFSDTDGLEESQHVFIEGASVQRQWCRALADCRASTVVMELGFGSGLNFLATAQRWIQWRERTPAARELRLKFFSIENQPMHVNDMRRALSRWADSLSLATELTQRMPPRVRGQHRRLFADANIELVVLYDDVRTALAQLVAPLPFIDAVYLDGFSPAANPAMWQHGVLQRLSELSRPDATLATFSAAGALRRALQRVGYEVSRRPGYGRKREMLAAVRTRAPEKRLLRDRAPWFALPPMSQPERVAVIGAGLAGVSSANALARRAIDVTIYESAATPAYATSSVPVAGWFPQLSLDFDPRSEILWQACLMVDRLLQDIEANAAPESDPRWYDRRGCFFVADTPERQSRLRSIADRLAQVGLTTEFVDAEVAQLRTGLALRHPGLDCALGGSVVPARLCEQLLQLPNIKLRCATTINSISQRDGKWQLQHRDGVERGFDAVVVASGAQTDLIDDYLRMDYDRNNGMVTHIDHPTLAQQQRLMCFKGYLTTALGPDGSHVTGATTNRGQHTPENETGLQAQNIARLRAILPAIGDTPAHFAPSSEVNAVDAGINATSGDNHMGWHGQRLSSRDRLPLIGPVVNGDSLHESLRHYQQAPAMRDFHKPEFFDGLCVNLAHGGRGASTALLCAELLAQMMCSEPLCLPRRLVHALLPSRFQVRDTLAPEAQSADVDAHC